MIYQRHQKRFRSGSHSFVTLQVEGVSAVLIAVDIAIPMLLAQLRLR